MHSLTMSNKDAYFIYFTGEKHDPTNSEETVLSVKGLDQFAWDPDFIKAVLCPIRNTWECGITATEDN